MSDSFNSSSSFDSSNKSSGASNELEDFLTVEKHKAQLTAQILEFNDLCWDKCVDKPGGKVDGKTETCLNNCVNRFIDVSLFITTRFAQLLQKSGGTM